MCLACAEPEAPSCLGCKKKIMSGAVSNTKEGSFHAACFCCKKCRRPIKGPYAPGPLCDACVDRPACVQCSKPIGTQGITVGGKTYHPECFVCTGCKKPIGSSFLAGKTGFMCHSCSPKCAGCGQVLEGGYISVDGKEFHQGCLKCSECKAQLQDKLLPNATRTGYLCVGCTRKHVAKKEAVEERSRLRSEDYLRKRNTMDFGLQWDPKLAQPNDVSLRTLGVSGFPNQHCCLVFNPRTRAVGLAPTRFKQAEVNLYYLAMSLKILKETQRECQFSLDPKGTISDEKQVKAFYPSSLANTVFGEVLFQADYTLKQLSFGEGARPVKDMMSIFELMEQSGSTEPLQSRQWFVISNSGVRRTADGVVCPFVDMGVSARRIEQGPDGKYRDAPMTKNTDASVQYAQSFTRNFGAIADAIPEIGELREVGRAMVLARYLLEQGASLDARTASKFAAVVVGDKARYPMEIPTLRRQRTKSSVDLGGSGELSVSRRTMVMHGGVDLRATQEKKVPEVQVPEQVLEPQAPKFKCPLFVAAAA